MKKYKTKDEHMIKRTAAQRVLADKAYASKANRERLRSHARDEIMRKATHGRPGKAKVTP